MARFELARTEKFGGQGGGGFFTLKGKNTAHIRFLYNDASDVDGYTVHGVKVHGKDRYVDCLCGENEDQNKCPFCRAGMRTEVRFFVPVYNEDTDTVLTWDRGKAFGRRLENLFNKYAVEAPLSATCFNVSREINEDGFPYYKIKPEYNDGTEVDELPEYTTTVYGKLILIKSADEMEYYLENGDFQEEDTEV